MKIRNVLLSALLVLTAVSFSLAHDPRTTAKEFSHSLNVEGSGKLALTYRSLHWNEPAYNTMKRDDNLRQRVVGSLWKRIGKVNADFDVVIGGVAVPKGSYDLGIHFGKADDFSLVLGAAGKDLTIPLKTVSDGPMVNYLTFDLRPTDKPDTFLIEGRGGKFICSAELRVPSLAPHEHGDKPHQHGN